MKIKKYNKSTIILVFLLITVVLSISLGPINSGSSQIKARETTITIKSQEPHRSQIIVWKDNGTVISNAQGDQEFATYFPDMICSDGAGGAIIAWHDNRGSDYDIYAQRIASNGKIQWKTNGTVICNAIGDQKDPKICCDGTGGAIITWIDLSGSDYDIYTQRIASNGKTQWKTNGTVICNAPENQYYHEICSTESGNAIIIWCDDRVKDWDMYAQKIDLNGKTYWGNGSIWGDKVDLNGTVICNVTGSQFYPKICKDGSGGAFITWYENRGLGSKEDIYAQRIDSDGDRQWIKNGTAISNLTTGSEEYPNICYSGKGEAIITWRDEAGNDEVVYAQKITSDGKTLWANNGTVICNGPGIRPPPQVCSDGANGAIISWIDNRGTDKDIYAQRINKTGDTQWGDGTMWGVFQDRNGTVICNANNSQINIQMCSDGANGAIISWIDNRGTDNDIYAQRINKTGDTQWGDGTMWGVFQDRNGTAICNAEGNQEVHNICYDGDESVIIVWQDQRGSDSDIYAQKIKLLRGGFYTLGDDDDDDDDDEELNVLLIVLIIVLVSVAAITIIIVILIKKG